MGIVEKGVHTPAVAASICSANIKRLASCKYSCFWNCNGLRAVIDRKCEPDSKLDPVSASCLTH